MDGWDKQVTSEPEQGTSSSELEDLLIIRVLRLVD